MGVEAFSFEQVAVWAGPRAPLAAAIGLGASVVLLLASAWVATELIARLPSDYLEAGSDVVQRPLLLRLLRNGLGILLVVLGLAMLVLPGQGLLTLLGGLLVLDFRGKARLLRRILSHPRVLPQLNRLRARMGRPPLALPLEALSRAADASLAAGRSRPSGRHS